MSEQQTTSACPHPEAVGKRWGEPISEERQAELQEISTCGSGTKTTRTATDLFMAFDSIGRMCTDYEKSL
jgi:hypothetical protein